MTVYAEWPLLDELKQVLDIRDEDEQWDGSEDGTRLTGILDSAIEHVKNDVGKWTEYDDIPTVQMSRAALRMAELMALRPEDTDGWATDPTYQRHLFGQRRRFAVG